MCYLFADPDPGPLMYADPNLDPALKFVLKNIKIPLEDVIGILRQNKYVHFISIVD